MTDIVLHDISDETHEALCQRAKRHGRTAEEEARVLIDDALMNEKILRIADEKGLGAALQAIGEAVGGVELDITRDKSAPRFARFD